MDVFIVYTARSGRMRAEHRVAGPDRLPGIKTEMTAQGRVYEWWAIDKADEFLDVARRHGIEDQAQAAIASSQGRI